MSADTDAWAELQALKSKRDSRRRKLEERKKERQEILTAGTAAGGVQVGQSAPRVPPRTEASVTSLKTGSVDEEANVDHVVEKSESVLQESVLEVALLRCLCEVALSLPIDSRQLLNNVSKTSSQMIQHDQIFNFLQKFAVQELITTQEKTLESGVTLEIVSADHAKLVALVATLSNSHNRKRKAEDYFEAEEAVNIEDATASGDEKKTDANDVLSLLSMASTRERENKRIGEEILELLSRPSIKEKTLAEQFRSQGGTSVREFCPHGTKSDCRRVSPKNRPCARLHFRKIIQSHTDETLGDCSFLNTCFHMESCKYVHYEVDSEKGRISTHSSGTLASSSIKPSLFQQGSAPLEKPSLEVPKGSATVLHPAQWLHCDLRFFDMTVLGKFSVIMADPPWDIHMELPYGTLSDDEMRQLNIPALQDEGLIFLWVTGRAMELGRECLQLWGYERVDELIWVKTNQLQRIIRTGRTGHWINHGKEHCLVGMKGNPAINRGLDADIIVAEVRATSHKPDEVYGIIERLSPGTRKIELFGRPHNIQPNWMTLGNQLEGAHLVEEDLCDRFYTRYPDGNCMVKPK